jgi:hypothetical protein
MATNDLVVKMTGSSSRLVTMVRKEMREAGLIHKLPRDHTSKIGARGPHNQPPQIPTAQIPNVDVPETQESDTKKLLDLANSLSEMDPEWTPEEMLKLCKLMANDPNEATTSRQSAIALYRKIKVELEGKGQLGPGPPLSHEDVVMRMMRIMQSQGLETSTEAFERAFNVGRAHEVDPSTAAPGVPEVDVASEYQDSGAGTSAREGELGVGRQLDPDSGGLGPGEPDRIGGPRTDPHSAGKVGPTRADEFDVGGAFGGGVD